ncbi:MAG: lipopolysaccharide biosynthesis protein [Armatimonadota bacterium]|nr:lipopolysaccharide biosynthesis protein [Armatimonadota bacterium]MDR7548999.1 lipopolysaccharide biosynthesis protein [Armatimonadota bacterium]
MVDRDANGGTQRMDTVAVRGAIWLAGDQIGSRIIDLGFAVVLARLLLPEHFGLLAMAATSAAFFRLFANLGLGAAIVQRREVDDEYLSTAFWANLVAGAVLFLIVAASGEILGIVLREPRVGAVVLFLSLRFVIAAGSATHVAMISRRLDYRALALRSVASTVIAGTVAVALASAGMGVWSLVGQELVRTVANTILLYRATGWRPRRRFSWAKFRDLWSFGGPLLLSRVFNYLIRNADNLLVGRYLGASNLGFYAFGFAIFAAPLNDFTAIVHRVMFSALSRLQGDERRFRRGFLLATRYATMILMPVMTGLALVAPFLVVVFFGTKWEPSGPVVSLLALAGFVAMTTALGPSGLQASGRPELHLKGSVLSVLVYVPAFALGLRWGIVGVASGYLAATMVLAPFGYRFLRQATGVTLPELWEAMVPAITGCALMAAAVWPARWALQAAAVPALPTLVVLVALGGLVYVGVLWAMQRHAMLGLIGAVREALPRPFGRLVGVAE